MSMNLMAQAMSIKVGNPLRKLVLIKIADNANDKGECWPSYQHVADHCECSKSAVRAHIEALIKMGLITKENRLGVNNGKGNTSNLYYLTLDAPVSSESIAPCAVKKHSPMPPKSTGLCQQVAPPMPSESTPPVSSDGTRTSHSFEPVKEPVNEPIAVGASVDESVRVRSNRPEYSPEFEQAWLAYPKRAGGNSKSAAFKAWKARLNDGVNSETMLEGVKRYAGWVSAMGNSGTQFVKQAVTFFGPDRHFEESWEVPAVSAARREDPYFKASYDNVDYSQIPAGFRG